MKAIHGGKSKNDRIDSLKIAGLLRSGMIPMAYKKRLTRKHGKSKALTIFFQKLGRGVYYMLKRGKAFDMDKFLGDQKEKSGQTARLSGTDEAMSRYVSSAFDYFLTARL